MRRIKAENILAIVDFFYYGEANICQTNLDEFLHIAGELQLKGLDGTKYEGEENLSEQSDQPPFPSTGTKRKTNTFDTNFFLQNSSLISESYSDITSSMTVALPKHEFSGKMSDLDGLIDSMMKVWLEVQTNK